MIGTLSETQVFIFKRSLGGFRGSASYLPMHMKLEVRIMYVLYLLAGGVCFINHFYKINFFFVSAVFSTA